MLLGVVYERKGDAPKTQQALGVEYAEGFLHLSSGWLVGLHYSGHPLSAGSSRSSLTSEPAPILRHRLNQAGRVAVSLGFSSARCR